MCSILCIASVLLTVLIKANQKKFQMKRKKKEGKTATRNTLSLINSEINSILEVLDEFFQLMKTKHDPYQESKMNQQRRRLNTKW